MLRYIESFVISLSIIAVLLAIVGYIYKKGIIVSQDEWFGNFMIDVAKNDALVGCFVIVVYFVFRCI